MRTVTCICDFCKKEIQHEKEMVTAEIPFVTANHKTPQKRELMLTKKDICIDCAMKMQKIMTGREVIVRI